MKVPVNTPLFVWEWMPDSLTLEGIREFLESVPDGKLMASLESWRGRGRDDYPIHVLWGTLLLQIALRHTTMAGCLGELRRNRDLRRLVGAEGEDQVPKAWNMLRRGVAAAPPWVLEGAGAGAASDVAAGGV